MIETKEKFYLYRLFKGKLNKKFHIFILIFLSLISIIYICNEARSQHQKKIVKVIVTAEHLSADKETHLLKLWDNVEIDQGGILIKAKEASYDMQLKAFSLSGGVSLSRPGTEISGDKVTIYQEEQKGVWEGNVKFVQKKNNQYRMNKKLNNFLKSGPVTISCDKMEFSWGHPIKAVATGNVKANQKDKHISSDMATYTEFPQELILENNVKLEQEKKARINCSKLTLYITEERVQAQGIEINFKQFKNMFRSK